MAGELRLGAGSGDLGHCGEQGGLSERQAGNVGGTRALQSRDGVLGLRVGPGGFWLSKGPEHARWTHHSTPGTWALWQRTHPSPVRTPHAAGMPHHASTRAHVGRPQPGLVRMKRKGRGAASVWCPATTPSSCLPLHPLASLGPQLGLGLALHAHLVSLRPPQRPEGAGVSVLERKV